MPNIDPSDVYPPNNLPGVAVPWGRSIENDTVALKEGHRSLRQSMAGLNRSTASQLDAFSDQLRSLPTTRVGHRREIDLPLGSGTYSYLGMGYQTSEFANAVSFTLSIHARGGTREVEGFFEVTGNDILWSGIGFNSWASSGGEVLSATTGYTHYIREGESMPYLGVALASPGGASTIDVELTVSATSWRAPQSEVDEYYEMNE